MGHIIDAECNNCGKHWRHWEGCGFMCKNYYCNKCGKVKSYKIFDNCSDLREQLVHYVSKWRCENVEEDKILLEKHIDAITEQIEICELQIIGVCDCGGKYKLRGKIICPDCHSQDIKEIFTGNWD